MPVSSNKTTAGGANGAFQTTHWSEFLEARSGDEGHRQRTLGELLSRYWKPVYCYLRCKGFDREDSKDLTQGFFHKVVLGRGLFERADRAKGRFRTFLLTCLNRYVAKIQRAGRAKRRVPEGGLVSLEHVDWLNVPEPAHCTTPSEVFDYAWASALLDQVLEWVRRKCCETGNRVDWELFRERFLLPILDNSDVPSLDCLCEKYGVGKPARASKMILRVKGVFRAALRREVRQLVDSDDQVEDEIGYLMKIFSKGEGRFGSDMAIYK